MTAISIGGLSVACVSQPGFLRHLKERSLCSCSYADCTNVHTSWTSSFPKIVLRSSQLQPYGYLILHPRPPNRKRSFQAVSFQDVAENDSEGNDTSSASSTPTLDWQQRERLWNQLQGSFQHWRQELKDRGSLQVAKDLLAITEVQLKKKADAKQALTKELQKLKAPEPAALWSTMDPSIKWPLVTFGVFYLAVTISCGKTVSDNLWRVWLIGPFAMSFYIQLGIRAGRLYQKHAARHVERLVQRGAQLLSDIRSGKFQQDVRNGITTGRKYFTDQRSSFLHYLKTRAVYDARDNLIRFAMWLYEKYEDVIDWLWPSWRIFVRFLANLL